MNTKICFLNDSVWRRISILSILIHNFIYLVFELVCTKDDSETFESGESVWQSDTPSLHSDWSEKAVAIERTSNGLDRLWSTEINQLSALVNIATIETSKTRKKGKEFKEILGKLRKVQYRSSIAPHTLINLLVLHNDFWMIN